MRGVPLHGIGLQMHLTTSPGSFTSMAANIQRLTGLGLQVQITEFDVRLPVNSSGVASAASLATEAQIYQNVVALCLANARCTAVQSWVFTDEYSWIPGTYPGFGAALELDANYQPKPAYQSMQTAMTATPPVASSAGLVNAASYLGAGVAPGEVVLLFGATFGPANLVLAQPDNNGTIPSQCAQTRLLFDGNPAPVLYSRVGQLAAVVPSSVSGKATTQVEYEYMGLRSAPMKVSVVPAMPGVFGDAILNATYQVVSQSHPAHRGDYVSLFVTGAGLTVPWADGQVQTNPPFPVLPTPPVVKIGGIECPVQYAGGAAGLVSGVAQINVLIADTVPSGLQPVTVAVGDASSSPDVSTWIQ